MIANTEPNGEGSRPIEAGAVRGALEEWLADLDLVGADAVRAQLARSLAAELDDPAAPRYAKPRVASELRAVVEDLAQVTSGEAERLLRHDVEAMLAEVGA